ncbi:hypothetical protein GXW74_19780 [Roseomonas eburnea]|uniref:Uncharacterized protein n=1 Tax=Neoroseomonas eburnea TaxID=1346889 RepID=A0A9X9XGA6_9PROT|nr:hypothetical protein [Neoroseomonas eburnea]MBR0682742.1 hypothetical protein [Neoroseomonas eburnea]
MAETAVLAAVAASAVVGAGTAIYSGQQQAAAAKAQAQATAAQYEEERRAARLAAEQEEAAKRRDLGRVLSAADALRAGRGLDLGSQTGEAIRRASIDAAEGDIETIRANDNRTGRRLGLAADAALRRGGETANAAIIGSYGQAVGSLASGARQIYGMTR